MEGKNLKALRVTINKREEKKITHKTPYITDWTILSGMTGFCFSDSKLTGFSCSPFSFLSFFLAQSNISARLFVTPRMARLRRRPGYEIQTHISLVPGNLPSVRDQNGPDWKVLC